MAFSIDILQIFAGILETNEHPAHNISQCERQKLERYNLLNPYIMALLYSIIFIFSTFGNCTVIFVMCIRARSHSVTSMLITNLAASDLLLCFTSLWITPVYFFLQNWPWGGIMCHFFPLVQSASVFNSALTLLAISVDRYYSVCRHQKSPYQIFNLTPKTCIFLVMGIWAVSFALATPYSLNMEVVKRQCGLRCTENWGNTNILNSMEVKIIYGFIAMILQFAIPIVYISFSYLKIYLYLKRQCRQSNFRLRIVSTKKRSLFRMLLMMTGMFVVCWLPINVLNMMRDLHLIKWIQPFAKKFIFAHLIAMCATTINPLIYAFMNLTFRDEFARIAPELHFKLCNSLCRKNKNDDASPEQQSKTRPLLKMNNMEKVSLKQKTDGTAEMRRNASNSSLDISNRPKISDNKHEVVSTTRETTPDQQSPVEF